MKPYAMRPAPAASVETVRKFWQSHVNNEYYTSAVRGSESYFQEIQERRYQPVHRRRVDIPRRVGR